MINHQRPRLMHRSARGRTADIPHARLHRNENNAGKTLRVTQTRSADVTHRLGHFTQPHHVIHSTVSCDSITDLESAHNTSLLNMSRHFSNNHII